MTAASISVIIPAFNAAPYIGEAVSSVLRQTQSVSEIIVVDDGSTDDTAETARSFPDVRLISCEHAGQASARNLGVRQAIGDFIAFLDADDVWADKKISLQLPQLENFDLVFGLVEEFITPGFERELTTKPRPVMPGMLPGTVLMRRSTFASVGEFANLRVGEFVDWMSKAKRLELKTTTVSEVVLYRRLHQTNLGRQENSSNQDYVSILKAHVDRMRDKS